MATSDDVSPAPVSANKERVRVWDLPTRLFHWLLVLTILSAWVSYEYAEDIGDETLVWHRWNGLAVLVLLVWRFLWGFAGSSTARFASFVRGPTAIFGYLKGLATGRSAHYLGHNPAGAAMVLALMGIVAVIAALGLFTTDDNDLVGGPLYRLVSSSWNSWSGHWHEELFDALLLPLIVLHVAANALYGLIKKDPLIPAMITGEKPAADYVDEKDATMVSRPLVRAFLCLVIAKAIVFGAILAVGGRLEI